MIIDLTEAAIWEIRDRLVHRIQVCRSIAKAEDNDLMCQDYLHCADRAQKALSQIEIGVEKIRKETKERKNDDT